MAEGLADVADLLARAGVPHAVIGAHAVNAWLEPRFTADVDVTVAAGDAEIARLRAVFAEAGFSVAREHGAAAASGPDFVRFTSEQSRLVIEIQAAKTELQRAVIRRAVVSASGLRVATPEDLVVLKLIADRPKDQADLLGLAALPGLDWPHVERWAEAWGVSDRLASLRAKVPPAGR